MSNRRFIVFFLVGIAFLSAVLAFLSWRARGGERGDAEHALYVPPGSRRGR